MLASTSTSSPALQSPSRLASRRVASRSQLLALIGEELDNEDEICGVVISPRKVQDKLAIWTKNADSEQVVMAIGRKLRQVLELSPADKLEYLVRSLSRALVSSQHGRLTRRCGAIFEMGNAFCARIFELPRFVPTIGCRLQTCFFVSIAHSRRFMPTPTRRARVLGFTARSPQH